ncbi:AMP-binding protein [Demequina lutea]|uniref:Long-chain acyl-CoA synthetase n=1 Tax=Demequina lutea TaxID=431489 RepID=A0A7Y9Z8I3_9MICO|nr:AMP-binding protein [Demequina lutea]NYI40581.1 long-chain acyl-CoA synthetase [Demequina lutea]
MDTLQKLWEAARAPSVPREVDIPYETLVDGLDRAAASWPDHIAIDFLGATTTYAQLAADVARAAGLLHERGVRKGDRVAIALPNCTTHIVTFNAVLRLGAIVVSINPTLAAHGIASQLADSGATVFIAWDKTLERVVAEEGVPSYATFPVDLSADLPTFKRLALHLPVKKARTLRGQMTTTAFPGRPRWHTIVANAKPLSSDVECPSPEDVAAFLYTGGTTGTPKAAMLTHRNIVANTVQSAAWTGAQPATEVIYGVLPFFHAFGMMLGLSYPVRIGATLVVFPQFTADLFLAAQKRRPGTFLPAVPPMLDRIADAAESKGADLTSFSVALSGSMALSAKTAARWERLTGGLVIEGYGLTETSPVAVGNPLTGARRPGTLGIPYPSTQIRVVDPEDPSQDVEPGESGELLIKGPQVFSGYWNLPEETAAQLLPGGWLRTGDVVQIGEDGFVVLVDRLKELIVSGGFKVYPSQVEDHVRLMPGVSDVVVVGLPHGDLGETVIAAIVPEEGHEPVSLEAVREWCSESFAKYALPRKVVILNELPRSQIGKVLRRSVRMDLIREAP